MLQLEDSMVSRDEELTVPTKDRTWRQMSIRPDWIPTVAMQCCHPPTRSLAHPGLVPILLHKIPGQALQPFCP